MEKRDLVIIGGGPAGMAAAIAAESAGIKDILIIDREKTLGGILNQCIHNGFGLHKFGRELTGPEFAWELERDVRERNIECKLKTMVTGITDDKTVTATNEEDGVFEIKAKAIILAMGCRERSRGALNIPGARPAGIYSAGTAQKYVNIMGYLPGKSVVILGSGDIGLIMARRMSLEGAKVKAVCEIMPYSGGLTRNIVQCLDDFDIPLKLSHTITKIHGADRVTGVTIAEVDEKRNPICGTEEYIECDTVLLSVGLLPENELTKQAGIALDNVTGGAVVDQHRETSVSGIFSCGNVLHVHDLADYAAEEAETAGISAADYILNGRKECSKISVKPGENVRYCVPQFISAGENENEETVLFFRVGNILRNVKITVKQGENIIYEKKKQKAAPGEMETVKIKSSMLSMSTDISLEVKEQ